MKRALGFSEVRGNSVAYTEDGLPVSSMGVDFRDLNNDGQPDLVITALGGEMFPFILNSGHGFSALSRTSRAWVCSRNQKRLGSGAYDLDN